MAETRGPDPETAVVIAGLQAWDEDTEETFSRRGKSVATRTILCHWADRIELARYLLGGSRQVEEGEITEDPHVYPALASIVVRDVKTSGVGRRSVGTDGMVAYEWARLKVNYGTADWETGSLPDAPDVGDEELNFSRSAVALDDQKATFKYSGDSADVPNSVAPSFTFATISFTKTRYNVPSLPTTLISGLIDMTNNAVLFGAPAETIVLRGARSRRRITVNGPANFDITYALEFHRETWNKMPRAGVTPLWQPVVIKGTGEKPHPPANLHQLFGLTPPSP